MFYAVMFVAMSVGIYFTVRSASILYKMVVEPDVVESTPIFGSVQQEIDKILDYAIRTSYSQAVLALAWNGQHLDHYKIARRAARMAHRRVVAAGLMDPDTKVGVLQRLVNQKLTPDTIKYYIDEA